MLSFDATDEIKQTIQVKDWLPGKLSDALEESFLKYCSEVLQHFGLPCFCPYQPFKDASCIHDFDLVVHRELKLVVVGSHT